MMNTALSAFVSKATAKNRITFGDVRRLQRDVLSDGVVSREEAELLITLDRNIGDDRSQLGRLPGGDDHGLCGLVRGADWLDR